MYFKTILVSTFCFLAVNSANALTDKGTEACGKDNDKLSCLNWEYFTSERNADICTDINDTYKTAFKCKQPGLFLTPDPNREVPGLDALTKYVTFSGYDLTAKSSALAIAFNSKDTALVKATKVMQHGTGDLTFFSDEIKKRYKAFVEAYKCNPVITRSGDWNYTAIIADSGETFPAQCGSTQGTTNKAFLKRLIINKFGVQSSGSGAYSWDRDKYFDDYETLLKKNGSSYAFCSNILYSQCTVPVAEITNEFSCPSIVLKNYFADNQYANNEKIKIMDINKYTADCVKKAKEKGNLEISKITIKGSANSENNTGGLCAKGFMHLSIERANAAFTKIQKELQKLGVEVKDDAFTASPEGTNGDGTSGPCAYLLNEDGTMAGPPSYALPKDKIKEILAPYKYVKIIISFKDKNSTPRKPASGVECCDVLRLCRDLVFECPTLQTGKINSAEFAKTL
jgi:hypothetical protein